MQVTYRDEKIPIPAWNPPYYFVISRRLKWSPQEVEVFQLVAEPSMAYALYKYLQERQKGTMDEIVFEYFLFDSFNKTALDYCKNAYDKVIVDGGSVDLKIVP